MLRLLESEIETDARVLGERERERVGGKDPF